MPPNHPRCVTSQMRAVVMELSKGLRYTELLLKECTRCSAQKQTMLAHPSAAGRGAGEREVVSGDNARRWQVGGRQVEVRRQAGAWQAVGMLRCDCWGAAGDQDLWNG